VNIGLVEYDHNIDPNYCTLTKNGLRLIENDESKKEADEVNTGKTDELKDRENRILNYLEEMPWAGVQDIANKFSGVTKDAIYQTLATMVEEERIQIEKVGRKNAYALPGVEEPTENREVDTSRNTTMEKKYKQLKEEYKDLPENKGMVEDMSGTVKVELVNGIDDPIFPAHYPNGNTIFNECDIVGFLKNTASEIIVKPRTIVIAKFQGKDEILRGHGDLPIELQGRTEMTAIPGDDTYQLDIKVEV